MHKYHEHKSLHEWMHVDHVSELRVSTWTDSVTEDNMQNKFHKNLSLNSLG